MARGPKDKQTAQEGPGVLAMRVRVGKGMLGTGVAAGPFLPADPSLRSPGQYCCPPLGAWALALCRLVLLPQQPRPPHSCALQNDSGAAPGPALAWEWW